jgi:hypothetical protein
MLLHVSSAGVSVELTEVSESAAAQHETGVSPAGGTSKVEAGEPLLHWQSSAGAFDMYVFLFCGLGISY